MEHLLSVAFDNIASKDTAKLRKGLRQVEGLLVQITLSPPNQSASPTKHGLLASPSPSAPRTASEPKPLAELPHDRAYQEFSRLQGSFEWNVATKVIDCLQRLMGMGNGVKRNTIDVEPLANLSRGTVVDSLIGSTLDVLLGVLLLHPPSRSLFAREINMNLLVDLLDPSTRPQIIVGTIDVLVASLLEHLQNARIFENVDGVHTLNLLRQSNAATDLVRERVGEFFHVYSLPENQPQPGSPEYGPAFATSPSSPMAISPSRRMVPAVPPGLQIDR